MIINQTPKANTIVKSNTDVTLVVSSGGEQIAVPDVTDKTQDEAIAALTNAGLKPKQPESVASDTIAVGQCCQHRPCRQHQSGEGDRNQGLVSSGPLDQKISVPNVFGNSLTDAEAKIFAAGLTVGSKSYQDDTGKPKDTVISTDPLNGVKLNKGDKVNLVLSSGKSSSKSVRRLC